MADTFTTTIFETTYKDDFKDSDNYHRILFNSGRALQARELTQMQTIIQAEIERFGTNIFKEGGKVSGGNITLNTVEFIKLATGALPSDPSTVVGQTFTDTDGIKVKILRATEATGSDPDTIFVEYIDTLSGTAGANQVRCANGGTLTHSLGTLDPITIASSAATGEGLEASIAKGSFYVQGHFVFAKAQTVVVAKYSRTPSLDLGFKLVQDIVKETDDEDLYDNQGAAPNVAAPGAHRYRITLTLATRDSLAASDNFVFLCRISNGRVGSQVTPDNSYNVIRDVMARRTKEESGDYIVKEYTAKFDPLNDSNLSLDVTGGVAYVDGYRISTPSEDITVPKSQTTQEVVGDTVIPVYGNYVLFDSNYNLPELNAKSLIYDGTLDSAGAAPNTIGTARIRHYEEDAADHRAYLYDVQMRSGSNFANAKAIGAGSQEYISIKLESGRALAKSTLDNTLLFPLSRQRPSTIAYTASNDIAVQKKYTVTTNGSGVLASNQAISGGDTFTSSSSWVATRTDGKMDTLAFNISLGSPSGTEFNITSGADNSQQYDIYALQTLKGPTNFSAKSKSLAAAEKLTLSMTNDLDSDGFGTKFLSLRKADIYKVEEISLNSEGGTDISNFFNVDNGQRDNFYGIGRLVKKSGVSLPVGNAFVKFRHFTHSTSGSHFDVTSYPTGDSVGYAGIPNHTLQTGETVNLRDQLDFRPVSGILADSAGVMQFTFDSAGGGSQIVPLLPVNGQSFDVNATYYLKRADTLTLSSADNDKGSLPRGALKYIQGVPSFNPQLPLVPDGSLPIYNFFLNGFTLNESDLSSEILEHKRFTMSDIQRLEERIEDLEELTTLSLLENSTENLTVVDSAGLERTKSGFLADPFNDYSFADFTRSEYRAAIEELNGTMRPYVVANEIRLLYDSATSTTQRGPSAVSGELLTLPIDSNFTYIDQSLATETENINPFAVLTGKGVLQLSPSSDTYIERRRAPEIIVDGGTIVNTRTVRIAFGAQDTENKSDRSEPFGGRESPGGNDGGGSSGGGSCFAIGTLLLLANGVLRAIENIDIGDILMEGGRVRTLIIGDGTTEDWYMYGSTKLTGSHTVYENGEWKRVCESEKAVRSTPEKRIYTLINEEHRVVAADGTIFGDYDEVDNRDIEPQLLEMMNKENVPNAVRKVEAA